MNFFDEVTQKDAFGIHRSVKKAFDENGFRYYCTYMIIIIVGNN